MFVSRMTKLPSVREIGPSLVIWKLNDTIVFSGKMNDAGTAGSRSSAQFHLGGRRRGLHTRGRTRSPHAINGEPADQTARGKSGLPVTAPERQASHADRARGAAAFVFAAHSRA